MEEETIYNRFVQVLGEWVCIHDEHIHFHGKDSSKPLIKLCGSTLRVRANDAWTKLPKHLQEAMVAHEIGHREMNHASIPQDNPFFRCGCVLHGTVDTREVEADRYACKLITKDAYISALKEIAELAKDISSAGNWIVIREYEYRIKALQDSER